MNLNKKIIALTMSAVMGVACCGLGGCAPQIGGGVTPDYINPTQKNIMQVDKMPSRASNYKLIDFNQQALDVDRVLFDFAKKTTIDSYNPNTYGPIGYWDDSQINIDYRAYGFPSYIGSNSAGVATAQEGVTVLGELWGATSAGIDKSNQSFGKNERYNFVKMAKQYYNKAPNTFILNNVNGATGNTFWYEIYPQIEFIRLAELYPNETWMNEIILAGAEKWDRALPNFKKTVDGAPVVAFDFRSYDFKTNKPIADTPSMPWNEPPNGGLAMIFYYAYTLTGDEKYLNDVKYVLDYLQTWEKNPYYEILSDYACYVGAVMNARHGTNYDIQKFINYSFEGDCEFRPMSQVVNAKWGDYDAYGLMGFGYSDVSGEGYAFAMNTWHLAATLATTLRYDYRMADDIGKWFMHMANSSRIFFGNELPQANQTCVAAPCDPNKAIAYEGVRSKYKDAVPCAMGDPTVHGWGKTDFGIYGSGHVGLLGGIVESTDVDEILRVDLTKLDTLRKDDYQSYLYYNPYNTTKKVSLTLISPAKLYNPITNKVLSESASGTYTISIPALTSVAVTLLPVGAKITTTDGIVKANDKQISMIKPSVNILSPDRPKQNITSDTVFTFSSFAPENDKITNMTVKIGSKEIYSGAPIESLTLGSAVLPRGVMNLVVEVTTQNGLKDIASIRVKRS